MVSFNSFVLSVFGDSLNLAEVCFKDKIVVPLGAPPCCFLQPCNKPIITTRNLNFLTIGTKLLVAVKIAVLVIEILLSAVGFLTTSTRSFSSPSVCSGRTYTQCSSPSPLRQIKASSS